MVDRLISLLTSWDEQFRALGLRFLCLSIDELSDDDLKNIREQIKDFYIGVSSDSDIGNSACLNKAALILIHSPIESVKSELQRHCENCI